ncbi:MAG: hypothetical protein ACJAVV_000072 [Alphaproteobacteria bacterium]
MSAGLLDDVSKFGEQEQVIVSVSYHDADVSQPVSAPASLRLFGLGLFGFAARRFYKK